MLWIILGVIFLLAAAVFKFALIGYGFAAGCCIAAAVICLLYFLIKILKNYCPKAAKAAFITLTSVIGTAFIISVCVLFVIGSGAVTNSRKSADFAVIMGAGLNGSVPSLSLADRLDAAKEYLDENPDIRVIVTGGQGAGEDITEAECMRRELVAALISPERIIMEPKATSTEENAIYSMDIIRSLCDKEKPEIDIITSEYHLFRSKLYFERYGAEPFGVSARTSLLPLRVVYSIREVPAVIKAWLIK